MVGASPLHHSNGLAEHSIGSHICLFAPSHGGRPVALDVLERLPYRIDSGRATMVQRNWSFGTRPSLPGEGF